MGQFYLRLEAVNLDDFIYDTKDLSTIRGGGLLLLKSVDWVVNKIDSIQIKPLMTGASAGLYTFEVEDSDQAEQVPKLVLEYLTSHPQLKHATFVADVHPAQGKDKFSLDYEALLAKNRWLQMQSPAISVPAQNESISVEACAIDGVRPGTVKSHNPKNEINWVSQSVFSRRAYGRDQKQAFYQEQSGKSLTKPFTHDLEELTNDPGQENLHHKMAVIYLDGNKFGKLKKGRNSEMNRQCEFDAQLKTYRQTMLGNLLDRIAGDTAWKTSSGSYRLETLLWGGDEILWVVPAWKAWETLYFFFDESRKWSFMETKQLHHAGGVVFCHHNAPIHRITTLARDLGELAKEKDRERSLFAYEVLESFDHIGRDLVNYRRERCPQPINPHDEPDQRTLILAGDDMPQILATAKQLKEKLPRRKLYAMVDHLLEKTQPGGEINARSTKRQKLEKDLYSNLDDQASKALAELTPKLGGNDAQWLHLSVLWDYLV